MPNCPAGLDEDPQHLALRIEARRRLGVGQIRAMAKVDIEAFWGKEVTRVYIAGKLGEAKQVESTLTENGIDYAVEVEPFVTLILGILPSEYAGAGFYVLSEQAALARSILLAAGFTAGIEVDCHG